MTTETKAATLTPWAAAKAADVRLCADTYDHSGHPAIGRRCAAVVTVYRDTYGTPLPGEYGRGWVRFPVEAYTVLHLLGSRRSSLGFTLYRVAPVGDDGYSYGRGFEIGGEYMIDIDAGCATVTSVDSRA